MVEEVRVPLGHRDLGKLGTLATSPANPRPITGYRRLGIPQGRQPHFLDFLEPQSSRIQSRRLLSSVHGLTECTLRDQIIYLAAAASARWEGWGWDWRIRWSEAHSRD